MVPRMYSVELRAHNTLTVFICDVISVVLGNDGHSNLKMFLMTVTNTFPWLLCSELSMCFLARTCQRTSNWPLNCLSSI